MVPTIAMLKMLAPKVVSPPSWNIKHCTIKTKLKTIAPTYGPKVTEANAPPKKCPEVPPRTGKFNICAAKIKAAITPIKGTSLSFRTFLVFFKA